MKVPAWADALPMTSPGSHAAAIAVDGKRLKLPRHVLPSPGLGRAAQLPRGDRAPVPQLAVDDGI